jgi:hypothetical protein
VRIHPFQRSLAASKRSKPPILIRVCMLRASCSGGPLGLFKNMSGPKYDGKYLRSIVRELLGDTKISQTLRNVVIPTFDIKLLQPTIFSKYEVRASTNKHIYTDSVLAACCFYLVLRRSVLTRLLFTAAGHERCLQGRSALRRVHQHLRRADLPPGAPVRDQGQGRQAPGLQPHRRRRRRKQSGESSSSDHVSTQKNTFTRNHAQLEPNVLLSLW